MSAGGDETGDSGRPSGRTATAPSGQAGLIETRSGRSRTRPSASGVGRPYAYGLAIGGQAGVGHVLRRLLAEIDLTLAIHGYPQVRDLRRDALRRIGS